MVNSWRGWKRKIGIWYNLKNSELNKSLNFSRVLEIKPVGPNGSIGIKDAHSRVYSIGNSHSGGLVGAMETGLTLMELIQTKVRYLLWHFIC